MSKLAKIVLTFFLFCLVAYGNEIKLHDGDEEYIDLPDELAQPIGGLKKIYEQIQYPDKARKMGVQGKVYALVFINEEGKVDRVEIIKGIGFGCDEVVVDAIKNSRFRPGFLYGKPIKSKLSMKFEFKLR